MWFYIRFFALFDSVVIDINRGRLACSICCDGAFSYWFELQQLSKVWCSVSLLLNIYIFMYYI